MVYVKPKILFYFLIYAFGLAISLGVVCCRGIAFNVKEFVQFLHHFCIELSSPVMNDLTRQAMESKDMIAIDLCHTFC